jgi:hypothetical protein
MISSTFKEIKQAVELHVMTPIRTNVHSPFFHLITEILKSKPFYSDVFTTRRLAGG